MVLHTFLVLANLVGAAPKDSDAFPQATAAIPIFASDPQVGPRDAPLTLVAFGDSTQNYHRWVLAGIAPLRTRYGNKLRLVFKNVSINAGIHPDAILVGTSARGVYALGGVAAFEKFLELVGTHEGTFDQPTLTGLAVVAGVKDRKAFEEGILTQQWLRDVRASENLATDLDVRGAPMWYLNGLGFIGFLTERRLETEIFPAIDKELEASTATLKKGFKAIDVYGYRVKANADRSLVPTNEDLRKRTAVTPEAIGPLRLGMKMPEVEAVLRVKVWSNGTACGARLKGNDDCVYRLWFDALGTVEQIAYDPEVGDGFNFEGKTVVEWTTAPSIKRILGCGETAPGIGGSGTKCPGHLKVIEGGTRCLKTLQDEAETACVDAAGGRNRQRSLRPPVEVRLAR